MRAILAVDGGGTKTDAALIDERGHVVFHARGEGVNPFDQPDWSAVLEVLLARVPRPYGAAGLGLPGYGEAPEVTARQDEAARGLAVPLTLVNDVEAAHVGAFAGGAGTLILAGTGSMVWAADGAGGHTRAGGWGDVLGDEGSAHWIGLRALNRLTRSLDGRLAFGGLEQAVLEAVRGEWPSSPDLTPSAAVLTWLGRLGHPRSGIAALARVVDAAAERGEPEARQLLASAAGELAQAARAAQRRLPSAGPRWSVAGGVTRSRIVRDHLKGELGAAHFREVRLPPLGGAALLGARRAGWTLTPEWVQTLATELAHLPGGTPQGTRGEPCPTTSAP
ncbi:N-acetylglucosamine kinase [Deinococcus metallilatus]|uniref:N-acetylglucosamine kinase n=1 Tax=Deinococcus metallilatus TaxID=1211322 RepID=A0ABR6MNK4_9DEIO|nr:BadF/BadG/BcrA/BcrD ATPase family protein [Deinococcus metallilatus]MBB5293519.1 N-acetylglucosamine kinase [Deinococcus metallilatus]GMA15261.1 hypothetical protein GCM10025871_15920 [Deinococcus metallilatus]